MLLFDEIDRNIIQLFYKEKQQKGKFWGWFHEPIIVSLYEQLKARKQLQRQINKLLTKLNKLCTRLEKSFTSAPPMF